MTVGTLVLGLINGMLIGLLAVGIVLIFKSNRFLNLAQAQLGLLSAELLAKLALDWGWNWWHAFAVCVPVGAGVGLLVDRVVMRPLRARSASAATLMLVSLGITQVFLAVSLIPGLGPSAQALALSGYPLPFQSSVTVGGVVLGGAGILVLCVTPVLVAILALFLRFTRLGTMIRAAASNPDAARLSGVSVNRVSAIAWAIAGGLSAVAAILQSPSFGSNGSYDATSVGPEFLLLALGAVAFGALSSLPGALLGAVVLGEVQQIALAVTSSAGVSEVVVVIAIVVIVLFRSRAIGHNAISQGAIIDDRPPLRIPAHAGPVSQYYRQAMFVGFLAVGLAVPFIPSLSSQAALFDLALVLTYAVVAISLTVAIGWAGQISLGQFALVGAAAFIAAHMLSHGFSLVFVLIAGGLAGAVLMALIALPGSRVPGVTLTVISLGFAVVAPDWLFQQGWLGTSQPFGIAVNAPTVARGLGNPSSQLVVYYVALGVVALAAASMWALRHSQPGRRIIAVRDNETKAAMFRVRPFTVKVSALATSGFLAGVAGAMWADAWRNVAVNQFPAELSLEVLAAVVIGGLGSVSGAIAAAVAVYTLNILVAPHLSFLFGAQGGATIGFELLFGGVGLIVALRTYPQGIAGAVQSGFQAFLDRRSQRQDLAKSARPSQPRAVDSHQAELPLRNAAPARLSPLELEGSPGFVASVGNGSSPLLTSSSRSSDHAQSTLEPILQVTDIHLSFGGIQALSGTSLQIRSGEIVGLIGPNGAGKTSLLNVISGHERAQRGSVILGATDITLLSPERRAVLGLSRTFQDAALFPGLTLLEMMQVATDYEHSVGVVASVLSAPWARSGDAASRRRAWETLERFGLASWGNTLTRELSTGTRRIADLAAQVAARPRLLLLDEPTGGVAQREAEAFAPLLRQIRHELGLSVLIIEHDMPLLMDLCDRIYAMDQGEVICEGVPAEVRADPAVVTSYLGTSIGRHDDLEAAAVSSPSQTLATQLHPRCEDRA